MSTTPNKQVTPKKIQVFVGKELKAESNIHEEVIPEIHKLKDENIPEIKVVNHYHKVTLLYSKNDHEKNYKITEVEYVAPSKPSADGAVVKK